MEYLIAVLAALGAWWLSTVAILYRSGLPRASFGRTMLGASVVLVGGVSAIVISRNDGSAVGAYTAFLGAIAVYGWHEVSYLFGYVSGPRPLPCPENCSEWRRFVMGIKTCIYHEVAVVLTVSLVAALTWDTANQTGLWTLVVLWLMRWSAKLNIFLGVRNLHIEFWPEHLAYLTSFTRERSMNALFPVSIIAGTTVAALLITAAAAGEPGSAERTGSTLLATILALAILEHWLLILRVPDELLWQPGLRSRRPAPATGGDLGQGSC